MMKYIYQVIPITLAIFLALSQYSVAQDDGSDVQRALEALKEINEDHIEGTIGSAYVNRICSGLRAEPKIDSEVISELEGGQRVFLYNFYEKPYMKISVDSLTGYVSSGCLESNRNVIKVKYSGNPKLSRLVRKYGESAGNRIYDSEIWIGMTEEMLIESWGRPDDKNITETAYSRSEQWVYEKDKFDYSFVYLRDGKVDTIQR